MSRIRKMLLTLVVLLSFASYNSHAQVIVNVRPAVPVHERIGPPSPRHVWVDEEWIERGGRYEWAGGHWVLPPKPGLVWIPGHWAHRPRGWVWIRGHWRR